MGRTVRTARGDLVDFDLLAIKQQLAIAPVPVGVDERRKFIDEKDGIRVKQPQTIVGALAISQAAAEESASTPTAEEE